MKHQKYGPRKAMIWLWNEIRHISFYLPSHFISYFYWATNKWLCRQLPVIYHISGAYHSCSSLVMVFFWLQDLTSKHYVGSRLHMFRVLHLCKVQIQGHRGSEKVHTQIFFPVSSMPCFWTFHMESWNSNNLTHTSSTSLTPQQIQSRHGRNEKLKEVRYPSLSLHFIKANWLMCNTRSIDMANFTIPNLEEVWCQVLQGSSIT